MFSKKKWDFPKNCVNSSFRPFWRSRSAFSLCSVDKSYILILWMVSLSWLCYSLTRLSWNSVSGLAYLTPSFDSMSFSKLSIRLPSLDALCPRVVMDLVKLKLFVWWLSNQLLPPARLDGGETDDRLLWWSMSLYPWSEVPKDCPSREWAV